jgi:hypothetical protein
MRILAYLVIFLVMTTSARAAWREASSDNFIVYSDGSESELVSFTQRVEKIDQILRIMCGLHRPPAPVKVRIYLVSGEQAVQDLELTHRPVVGFYISRVSGGVAIADRDRASSQFDMDGQTVLYHEYTHHFMAQYAPSAYPVWYQEGFAEYFASTVIKTDGTVEVGRIETTRLPALYTERWLPTQQLMTDTLEQLPHKYWNQFYAQSWLLTHYLLTDDAKHQQLNQYLRLRAQGVSHAESLQKAFAVNDEQLGADLHDYFVGQKLIFRKLHLKELRVPDVSIRTLSRSEGDCLLLSVRLELGFPDKEAPTVLEQIRAAAARLPADEYAQGMLAEAEALYGDRARARDLLQAQLVSNPGNRRAMLNLAQLEVSAEQADEASYLAADRRARSLAVKANRLAPDDPEALYLFYLSFAHETEGPSKNAKDALQQAYFNLPQYPPIALAQAREYLNGGKPEDAVAVLKPMAYSPHEDEYTKKLRAWIQDIEAKKPAALADATEDTPGMGK